MLAQRTTWRRGVKTFVATTLGAPDESISRIDRIPGLSGQLPETEVWYTFPDQFPARFNAPHGAPGGHEMRYVAAPRLANASFWGEYGAFIKAR